MAGETHQRLIAELASVLATLRDVEILPARLCEAGRRMLSADGAVITLSTSLGQRVQLCATDELSAELEDLQDVVEQGPTIEAVETGTMLIAPFGDEDDERWSLMLEHGTRLGFDGTLIAVPLKVDGHVLGALTVHRQQPERPDDRDIGAFLGLALAIALLEDPDLALHEYAVCVGWPARAKVHQATGMVVAQVGVHPLDALALLKGQAFARDITMSDVADQIIERRINFRQFTIEGD